MQILFKVIVSTKMIFNVLDQIDFIIENTKINFLFEII